MGTDFEDRLFKAVKEVQASKSIRTQYDRGPVAIYMESAEDAFKIIRQVLDVPLSAELAANFHRFSNLFFSWRALAPFDQLAGEFHLWHLAEAVGRGPQPSSSHAVTSEAGRLAEEFRIFETHPVGGTGTYSALRFTHNQDSPEIWYVDLRQGPTRLHISYSDYLDVMLRTRGLYNWQYLFAEPDADNYGMRVSLPYLSEGLEFLTREFPDGDLSELLARLAERTRVVKP